MVRAGPNHSLPYGVWDGPADQGGDGDGGRVGDTQRHPGERAAHPRRPWRPLSGTANASYVNVQERTAQRGRARRRSGRPTQHARSRASASAILDPPPVPWDHPDGRACTGQGLSLASKKIQKTNITATRSTLLLEMSASRGGRLRGRRRPTPGSARMAATSTPSATAWS